MFAQPPTGTRIYAIGDIHGRADLMNRLLGLIADELRHDPRPARVVMVFLGDFVDRGPHSKTVIERLAAGAPPDGPLAGVEWVCLKGNHESMMHDFIVSTEMGANWCLNGGLETIQSYAGPIPKEVGSDLPALQLLLSRVLPPHHLRFLSRLPTVHSEGGLVFVHAGLRPGVVLADQEPFDHMWIRGQFLGAEEPFEKLVVHGHTIVGQAAVLPDRTRPIRVAVDTGAYRSGVLTAAVFEGATIRFLQT